MIRTVAARRSAPTRPALLTPAFVLGIGFAVGFIVLGLLAPIITLIQGITGGGH